MADRRRPEGPLSLLVGSAFIAHAAASYGVMLAVWAFAVARGVPPMELSGGVLLAPVYVLMWLFLVTPLVHLDRSGRSSVAPLAGVPNAVLAPAAGALYVAAFAVSLRFVHRRRVRAQRRALGQCPACGYDLTANVSGVCPECGQST